jgi:SNF2 family DNA or RNA helicase
MNVLTLTGATEDTNKVVQMFQKSRDHNILICTQKKAAESVTLTSARFAIYYSNIWSNDARLNSEARIRRKGSEIHKGIMYIDLITKKSVEEKVYQCLRKKKDLINELKTAFLEMRG